MEKISLAIPTYNSSPFISQTFADVVGDDRVHEIIINDDASSDFDQLKESLAKFKSPKIKIFRNTENLKAFRNKATAISKCECKWVVLLDSDNAISKKYIDTIYKTPWKKEVILCPEFAKPLHNYKRFSALLVDNINVKELILRDKFLAFLNTGNFFFNKDAYLNVFNSIDYDQYLSIIDAIYFTAYWITKGNKLQVCPELNYFHRNRADSFFMMNKDKSNDINRKIVENIIGVYLPPKKMVGSLAKFQYKIKSVFNLTYYFFFEKMYFLRR